VVKGINLYGDMHRFVPALASWFGVTVAEVPVKYRSRQFGTSKYGAGRIFRVLLDLMTVSFLLGYSTRPIRVFGAWGLISSLLGVGIGAYLTVAKIFYGVQLSDRPMLLLAVLLIMVGIQLISMGLLGEMLVRVYYESQGKQIYTVREELGD